ncbi:Y-family DNA polymerase [Tenacibaculum geojense]|uniref:Y-family DNA polymerase n=1 Tax=Tenacibaculum geojense TaxID=915352 RepID=A0ABW3JQF9_9FLAO
MFALVDCNNFYASCERVFNPNLLGKPVAILSNNDGCVISRSDEAKALGLPMGAPIFKWKSFCKANNVNVLSSNYPLYGDMSDRVMSILSQFTPDIEIYSIDESFLEFKGFDGFDFSDYGQQIRQRILKWTGIPTCVGVAPTKALSKVANKIARSNIKKSKGVVVINSDENRIKALQWLPIEKVWGIGHRLQKKLKAKGCSTAYDFTMLDSEWVRKTFSITLWKLQQDLKGISAISLDEPQTKKAIATTRSFEQSVTDISYIKERVSTFAVTCAEKMRKQNSSCHMVIVTLRSDSFRKELEQHRVSRTVILPHPTNSSLVIAKSAVTALDSMFKQGVHYKKAGVIVTGLVPDDNFQLDLFLSENPKHKPLMKTIDLINKKYKANTIKLASQDLKRTWKMKQNHLTPKYTTNINDIFIVK